jgi:hypothetical protein
MTNTNTTKCCLFAASVAVSVLLSANIPAHARQLDAAWAGTPYSGSEKMQIAHGNGNSAATPRGKVHPAYEDFSGTHSSDTPQNTRGMQGNPGVKGEEGSAGARSVSPDVNQAFEDFSGTHPTPAAMKTSMKGPSGLEGEAGNAGKTAGEWSPYNISGDVQDGCSRYLRCSGD